MTRAHSMFCNPKVKFLHYLLGPKARPDQSHCFSQHNFKNGVVWPSRASTFPLCSLRVPFWCIWNGPNKPFSSIAIDHVVFHLEEKKLVQLFPLCWDETRHILPPQLRPWEIVKKSPGTWRTRRNTKYMSFFSGAKKMVGLPWLFSLPKAFAACYGFRRTQSVVKQAICGLGARKFTSNTPRRGD